MSFRSLIVSLLAIAGPLALGACSDEDAPVTPSDDPADYTVDTSVEYTIEVSEPRFIVPIGRLPGEVRSQPANNNLDIVFHEGRLYLAWRTAPDHFASTLTRMYVVSSDDDGATWRYETEVALGTDVREPRLLSLGGRLFMYFFEAGDNPFAFEPVAMHRVERLSSGGWTEPEQTGRPGEVPWDLKVRNGIAYLTSYSGTHYDLDDPDVAVFFQQSTDGVTWRRVDSSVEVSYRGGSSEAAFEFTESGDAWIVTRNEDGDATGFGSLLCFAAADSLATWDCPSTSDPERYDSPEMFRHGDDIYLVARRDIGGPFDLGRRDLSERDQRLLYIPAYSDRPKRTAIYRVNTTDRRIEHILDLPSAGDTAFPAVRRTGPNTFLLANYTSPLDDDLDLTWLEGQTSNRGTVIYFVELTFAPM